MAACWRRGLGLGVVCWDSSNVAACMSSMLTYTYTRSHQVAQRVSRLSGGGKRKLEDEVSQVSLVFPCQPHMERDR